MKRKNSISKQLIFFSFVSSILLLGIIPALPFGDAFQSKNADFQCREGYVLVFRTIVNNYVCLTESTAERWVELGIAKIVVQTSYEIEITPSSDSEILPSWNDGNSKQKIIEFVNNVTNPSLSSFVPPKDRIATFDNDGTLWVEQPLYIPFVFHLEYLYEQLDTNPNLKSEHPYSDLVEKDDSITNEDLENIPGLFDAILVAYPNISQEDYIKKAKEFLDTTNHPRFNVLLKELTYKPMVELVEYLQQNDFKVYIVSGGFQGVTRSVSEEIYNIETENVIGTNPEFIYQLTEHGSVVIRQSTLATLNDEAEKPVNIEIQIGKKPIFACGNSGGDIEMLTLTHQYENHFACMLNHDDEKREYYYPNPEALEESQLNGWVVISMKNDFKIVFSNYK